MLGLEPTFFTGASDTHRLALRGQLLLVMVVLLRLWGVCHRVAGLWWPFHARRAMRGKGRQRRRRHGKVKFLGVKAVYRLLRSGGVVCSSRRWCSDVYSRLER